MAKITDPDTLTYSINSATNMLRVDTTAKTIALVQTGALTTDGVTGQCVYSKLKEVWKDDTTAIKFAFPMEAITEEKFDLINGWDWANSGTRELIRDAGWALKDGAGVSLEEYAGIISLGTLTGGSQVYYQQVSGGAASNIVLTDAVNQAVKVYGDASHGNFDRRSYFKIFVREQGDTYAQSQLSDIGVTTMTYQVYRFPLANAADTKITASDGTITTTAPYTGMSITWFGAAQARTIGGASRNFHVIIDGNGGTAEQIYEYVQYQLRQNSDIDAGAGTQTGKVTNAILRFVGDTLYTSLMPEGGVFIDNYLSADINRLVFVDDTGTERTFPYTASGTITFNDNLKNDASAKYWMFFTTLPGASNDFGETGAVIVDNASAADIAGNVSGANSVSFTFDYDGNVQGGRTSGTDAAVTVVAIGLNTGQYVKTTSTITRSTANNISLVAALERNYRNV